MLGYVRPEFDDSTALKLTENLTPKGKKLFLDSFGYYYAKHVFPKVDPSCFEPLYAKTGRRSYPVNILVNAEFYARAKGLTDEELIEACMYDLQTRAALHLYDAEDVFSLDTLQQFRVRNTNHTHYSGENLVRKCGFGLSNKMAAHMGTDLKMERGDTTFIESHSEILDRVSMMYYCCRNLCRILNRNDLAIPEQVWHYLKPNDFNQFSYHDKETSKEDKASAVIEDAHLLLETFKNHPFIPRFEAWELLHRCYTEQIIEENGVRRFRKSKAEGLHSSTLQSPADSTQTFRIKDGEEHHGYVLYIVESGIGDTSMITFWNYAVNITSDEILQLDYLSSLPDKSEDDPWITHVGDGHFGSMAAKELGMAKHVDIKTTNLTGKKPNLLLLEYMLNGDKTEILSCPAGEAPVKNSFVEKDQKIRAHFSKEKCDNCPMRDKCILKEQKKFNVVEITASALSRAETAKSMDDKDYNFFYRYRNGVEHNFSLFLRKYNIHLLPVRGFMSTRYWVDTIVVARNINKYCAWLGSG